VAGQGWPSTAPLELVLACSRDGQKSIDLVLGEPLGEARSEVVFRDGVPQLRRRPAGEAAVAPWRQGPDPLPLQPPGQNGQDRLRLRFWIDDEARLRLEGEDLLTGAFLEPRCLGPVR
jgi:hypothetical protein